MEEQSLAAVGASLGIMAVVIGAIFAVMVASMWKLFAKAGEPGWAAIVPLYNIIVLLKISDKPAWWIVLFMLPIANIIAPILVSMALAKSFGKDAGFGIGLAFVPIVFFPILAFGNSQYVGQGNAAQPTPLRPAA